MNGILVMNKEKDYTSRDVVNVVSKKLGTKKIGHTGTLDPMATGVLVLCVGEATKLVEIMMNHDKEYIAGITLGIETDTLDITGELLKQEAVFKTKEEIEEVLASFIGTYEQEVPMYSAVKVKGKKLYEYARAGEKVSLPKKEVTIFSLELIDEPNIQRHQVSFTIKTTVSKGTYIRSLIRDIATRLHTVGVMTSLVRTRVGEYTLEQALSLSQMNDSISLLPIDSALRYPKIKIEGELLKKVKNGALVPHRYQEDIVSFVDYQNQLIAIYKIYEKNPKLLKSWKMFISNDKNRKSV